MGFVERGGLLQALLNILVGEIDLPSRNKG
jgi:hypothetical protein